MRCPDAEAAVRMIAAIEAARADSDSVGGIVEVVARGVPAGWGDPTMDKLDAALAAALLSIPAIKGVEIGSGFAATRLRGSQSNDAMGVDGFRTNHAGGILGGISTGQDVVARIAVKPASSIARAQDSVNVAGEAVTVKVEGRHDPCICPRVVPVAEAMAALALADAFLRQCALRGRAPARRRRRADRGRRHGPRRRRGPIEEVASRLRLMGLAVHRSDERGRIVLGVVGDLGALDVDDVRHLPGVQDVVRISAPYKLASRAFRAEPTLVTVRDTVIGGNRIAIMAGPCAVESEDQVEEVAAAVARRGRDDPARRRVQAAHLALHVPGPGRGGPEDPAPRRRPPRPGRRHRGARHAARRRRRALRRRAADRRAQHAELRAAARGRPHAQAGAAQARHVGARSRSG